MVNPGTRWVHSSPSSRQLFISPSLNVPSRTFSGGLWPPSHLLPLSQSPAESDYGRLRSKALPKTWDVFEHKSTQDERKMLFQRKQEFNQSHPRTMLVWSEVIWWREESNPRCKDGEPNTERCKSFYTRYRRRSRQDLHRSLIEVARRTTPTRFLPSLVHVSSLNPYPHLKMTSRKI